MWSFAGFGIANISFVTPAAMDVVFDSAVVRALGCRGTSADCDNAAKTHRVSSAYVFNRHTELFP